MYMCSVLVYTMYSVCVLVCIQCTYTEFNSLFPDLPAPLASDAGGGSSVFVSVESVPVTTDDGQPTNVSS